jgi:hypothetical protein
MMSVASSEKPRIPYRDTQLYVLNLKLKAGNSNAQNVCEYYDCVANLDKEFRMAFCILNLLM